MGTNISRESPPGIERGHHKDTLQMTVNTTDTAPLIPPVGEDDPLSLEPLRKAFNAAYVDGSEIEALRGFWKVYDQLKAALTLTSQQLTNLRSERNAADARLAEVEAERDASESSEAALRAELADVRLENVALRNNNRRVKESWDELAQLSESRRQEIETLK